VTPVQIKTETKTKSKTVMKAPPPPPGRGKGECRCGLMVCNAAMSRHEKGAKHKEAMAKKEKKEMKQTECQILGVSDMGLVDIDTYESNAPAPIHQGRGVGRSIT
jgi:hypothetical protein